MGKKPRRGVFLAPFDELADARVFANLAASAEAHGWDGCFIWDHVAYQTPEKLVADPWVTMAAAAVATERIRIGPLVTPLSRRRVQKLARETVTLDRLSGGRLTLGVGLGVENNYELEPFGEVLDARERARLLDTGLERLTALWDGEFRPGPAQIPRIPIWVAGRWPNPGPVRRAARFDGMFPVDLDGPNSLETLAATLRALRGDLDGFDLVIRIKPGEEVTPWSDSGATWVLTTFGHQPRVAEVRDVIESGP